MPPQAASRLLVALVQVALGGSSLTLALTPSMAGVGEQTWPRAGISAPISPAACPRGGWSGEMRGALEVT